MSRASSKLSRASASLLRALANEERLRILETLVAGERCVSDLARDAGVDISTVSQRLRVLRRQGVLGHRRDGRNIYYWIRSKHVALLLEQVRAHVLESDRARR